MNKNSEKYIVFYDGDCGFCNTTVQFILEHEINDQIHFTALQSDFSLDFTEKNNFEKPDLSTLYFWNNGKLLKKSSAALAISKHLKKPYSWLFSLKLIPRFVRDFGYDFIAKHRRKIKNDACYLPTENQRKRFL